MNTPSMSITRKAFTGTIWLTGVQIGTMLFSFVANIVLARILMPEDFGVFALASSLTDFFFILNGWSFGLAIVQAKEASDEFIDTGYVLSFIIGTVVVLLVLASTIILRNYYESNVLRFLCILSVLQLINILSGYRGKLLERNLEYKKFSIVVFLSKFTPWLVVILLAYLGAGVWSFIGQQAFMSLILFFGYRTYSKHRFSWHINRKAGKQLFRFGGQMFISRGLEVVFYRLSNLMIGTRVGVDQLGYFNQAITLSEMGHRLSWPALGQIPFAVYSRIQDNEDKLSKGYELVNYFLLRFLIPLCLVFMLLGKQIVVFLYGEKWRPSGPLLQILAVYVIATPIFENMKTLLYSQNKIYGTIFSRLIQILFLALGIYLTLNSFGISGATYILDASALIGIIVMYFWTRKLVCIKTLSLILYPILSVFGTLVIWIFGISKLKNWQSNSTDVIISGLMICGIYFLLLFITERRKLLNNLRFILKIIIKNQDN